MSDLAIPEDGDLTPYGSEKKLSPLNDLPASVRKPVGFFWALNRHLLPTPIPLVLRLKVWMVKERLTAVEVRQVLNRLTSPELAANHRFASDLLCDLAAAVAEVVNRRRKLQEQVEQREAAEQTAAEAVPPDQWPAELRDMTRGIGRHPRS